MTYDPLAKRFVSLGETVVSFSLVSGLLED